MNAPSSSMRDLARRLLAESRTASFPHVHEAVVVSERLRISLTKFAGVDGFASLLRRALMLASSDELPLHGIKIDADGRLEGFEQLAAATRSGAAAEIIAQLLGLLVTFIGEPLTLTLVRESWPGRAPVESKPGESNSTRETGS